MTMLTVFVVLAGCGGGDEAEMDMSASDSMAGAPAAEPAGGAMQPAGGMGVTAQLQPVNNSGMAGEVTVTDRGAESEVMVRLTGATASGSHPGHIHSGSCAAIGGVIQPLQEITTDATGTGTMTTTVAIAPMTLMDGQHIVVYHADGAPATCAAIPGHAM